MAARRGYRPVGLLTRGSMRGSARRGCGRLVGAGRRSSQMFVASVVVLAVLFGLLPQVPVFAAPSGGGSVGTPARSVPTGAVRARPGTLALGSPARPVRAVWPAG